MRRDEAREPSFRGLHREPVVGAPRQQVVTRNRKVRNHHRAVIIRIKNARRLICLGGLYHRCPNALAFAYDNLEVVEADLAREIAAFEAAGRTPIGVRPMEQTTFAFVDEELSEP